MNKRQRISSAATLERLRLEHEYCDALLRFQDFCEDRGLSFRQAMITLLNEYTGFKPVPLTEFKPEDPKPNLMSIAQKARFERERSKVGKAP